MCAFVLSDVLIRVNKMYSISKYVINNIILFIHDLLFCVQTVGSYDKNAEISECILTEVLQW